MVSTVRWSCIGRVLVVTRQTNHHVPIESHADLFAAYAQIVPQKSDWPSGLLNVNIPPTAHKFLAIFNEYMGPEVNSRGRNVPVAGKPSSTSLPTSRHFITHRIVIPKISNDTSHFCLDSLSTSHSAESPFRLLAWA